MGHNPQDGERRRDLIELEKRLTTLEVTQKFTAEQVTTLREEMGDFRSSLFDLLNPLKDVVSTHTNDISWLKIWLVRLGVAGAGTSMAGGIGAWIIRHMK